VSEALINLAAIVWLCGTILVFFWIAGKAVKESGLVAGILVAIPWAVFWPVALVLAPFLGTFTKKK
jgi:hypothetical protein